MTTSKNARLFSSVLLLILLASVAASAQFTPTDDSYTSTLAGSTNFGASGVLDLQSGNKDTIFVRFDLSAIPPGYTGANVAQATLKLYVNSVPTGGTFNVDYVLGSWSEKTITANLEPAIGTTIASGVSLTTANKNDYVLINVTAALDAWLNGTQANDGLALVANSPLVASFTSKESTTTSHAPELDIVFNSTGAQGPQGPQGVQGPTGAQGSMGLTGPQGLSGTNGTGFNFRNAFINTAAYAVNDEVTYNGSTYVAIVASSGPNNPTPDQNAAAWSVMAQQGAPGAVGPQGPAGSQGLQGQTGAMGPIGVQGPEGATGTNGTGFNFTGPFSNSTSYNVNDVAAYNGSTYVSTVANQGAGTPDSNPTDWTLMAQQGAAGATGSTGPQGSTGAAGATGPQGPPGVVNPGAFIQNGTTQQTTASFNIDGSGTLGGTLTANVGGFGSASLNGSALVATAATGTVTSSGGYTISATNTGLGFNSAAIYGNFSNSSTAARGFGVYGNNNSPSGVGVFGSDSGGKLCCGYSAGVYGFSSAGYGVAGSTNGGVAAAFFSVSSNTNIIVGQGTSEQNVFRVDYTGKGFFDGGTQTGGADFAESVKVSGGPQFYEPGDVLVIDRVTNRQLRLASKPYSRLVAGIYSTKPGVLATPHPMDDPSIKKDEVPLAIVGIVPCKVTAANGPIHRGDLLVASSKPGYAMKGTDRTRLVGAVVGKALEPLSRGTGTIEVLVTLQ